jgi:hypothetical protein
MVNNKGASGASAATTTWITAVLPNGHPCTQVLQSVKGHEADQRQKIVRLALKVQHD